MKKDERVFGVVGNPQRNNSRVDILLINSVGEGGMWICNRNGNIENGYYTTSSDYLGCGEKQEDDLLHNYTVAKIKMSTWKTLKEKPLKKNIDTSFLPEYPLFSRTILFYPGIHYDCIFRSKLSIWYLNFSWYLTSSEP